MQDLNAFSRSPFPAFAKPENRDVRDVLRCHGPLQILELGDKAAELKPAAELERQLHSYKLRLEGITLSDDVEALAPREANPSRRRR